MGELTSARVKAFFSQVAYQVSVSKRTQKQLDLHLATGLNVVRDYVRPDENRLSDIFRDLLDPHGPHGQGSAFLDSFLKQFSLHEMALDAGSAMIREHYTSGGRKLDLLLTFADNKAIGIENKPFADDLPNQIKDYCEYLQERFPRGFLLFYLTPNRAAPPAHSINERERAALEASGNLRCICYCGEIKTWLDESYRDCKAEKVRWFLRDLIDFIDEEFLESMEFDDGE